MINDVIVIGGPTACGKSALAIRLAERLNCVVINGDSLQLYNALPVLTCQPDPAMQSRAPHRLYGVLPPDSKTNAAEWATRAQDEIAKAQANRCLPIVVGGTGLYLEALMQGLADIPAIDESIRLQVKADFTELGRDAFYQRLVRADPAASQLAPGDTQRCLRAWEVLKATGRSLIEWQATPRRNNGNSTFHRIAILLEREALYRACNERFLGLLSQGAIEEIRQFLEEFDENLPVTKALGFREIAGHLRGELSLSQATSLAQAATRHYAKRQATWFRNRFAKPESTVVVDKITDEFVDKIAATFTGI